LDVFIKQPAVTSDSNQSAVAPASPSAAARGIPPPMETASGVPRVSPGVAWGLAEVKRVSTVGMAGCWLRGFYSQLPPSPRAAPWALLRLPS